MQSRTEYAWIEPEPADGAVSDKLIAAEVPFPQALNVCVESLTYLARINTSTRAHDPSARLSPTEPRSLNQTVCVADETPLVMLPKPHPPVLAW